MISVTFRTYPMLMIAPLRFSGPLACTSTVAPLSVQRRRRLDGDRHALDRHRAARLDLVGRAGLELRALPVASCSSVALRLGRLRPLVISITIFWSLLISKSFFVCMMAFSLESSGEAAVLVLQEIGPGLVLAVEERAEHDRAAGVAVLEADDHLLVDLREHHEAAGVAGADTDAIRAQALSSLSLQRGELDPHAPHLRRGRCCWSRCRRRGPGSSRGARAGASGPAARASEAPGDAEVRLVAACLAAVGVGDAGDDVLAAEAGADVLDLRPCTRRVIFGLPNAVPSASTIESALRSRQRLGQRVGLARVVDHARRTEHLGRRRERATGPCWR